MTFQDQGKNKIKNLKSKSLGLQASLRSSISPPTIQHESMIIMGCNYNHNSCGSHQDSEGGQRERDKTGTLGQKWMEEFTTGY